MGFAEFAGIIPSVSGAFHGFAHWAAPAAVDGLWQGAAVAAGLAICLRMVPRVSASHRFATWIAGFGVAAGLPALPFVARLVTGFADGTPGSEPAIGGSAAHAWLQPLVVDARWSLAIAGVWLAISAYRAVDLGAHIVRLRRLWKAARPIEGEAASLAALALPDMRRVEICTTQDLDRPSVIGFFAPRILIPEWLLERLTHEELEQVILHESEHLRRRDDWTNLVQKLCLAAFPLNFALAWMDRRLAKEREMACDEGVVRVTGAPRAYAACLASLAERGLENRMARAEALSLGAFERRPELVHRVHSLLLGGQRLSPVAGRALVGVVGCGLIFGAVGLARTPQLVAFVPEQSAAPIAVAEAPYATLKLYAAARPDEGFRAVNTVATVPVRRANASHAPRELGDAARAVKVTQTVATGINARAENLKAEAPAGHPAQAAQPQEWMVVTWQVQTSVRAQDFKAQSVADYENGKSAEHSETAGAAQNRPANEMAVTRMFLGVYRASRAAQAANQPKSDAASKTAHPSATATELKTLQIRQAAVPLGDGWLVIQL
ncbi:MAG TPA: M56 family metallopeptidase [Terracidiphilus sp.]|nr:M56 family metallopeptidase [Terracidiphilus sp.]